MPEMDHCRAHLCWAQANSRSLASHFQHSGSFTYRIRDAYNMPAYKRLPALVVVYSPRSSLCWICCIYQPKKQMENPTTNTITPSGPHSSCVAQRSHYSITSLCFSTLIICIWSTLHFNIPTVRCTITRRFFLHVSWMFFALLAPELLLYTAINESAGTLLKKVHELHPNLKKPGMLACIFNWIRGRVNVSSQCQPPVIY
jgi:hypothetical protein